MGWDEREEDDRDELEGPSSGLGVPLTARELERLGLRGQPPARPPISRVVQDRRNGITRPAVYGREWSPTIGELSRWGSSVTLEWSANTTKEFGDLAFAEWVIPCGWSLLLWSPTPILAVPLEVVAQLGVGASVLPLTFLYTGGLSSPLGPIIPAQTIRIAARVTNPAAPQAPTTLSVILGLVSPP